MTTSTRAKRILLALGLLIAVLVVGALVGAYMLSRDPGFAFGNPNIVEANRFRTKLKRWEDASTNGQKGFVRFSQVEINSYIGRTMTNSADTNAPGVHLRRVGIELGSTNLMLFSWGEYRVMNLPLKFVVQRSFQIQQNGDNEWRLPMESLKVGELEVPKRFWDTLAPVLEPLDQPVKDRFAWHTNVPALLIRKNEISDRPELRLYTYKPIPSEDLH